MATITTDPSSGAQTANGLEPIYIAHNDKSFNSAFGVAVATPTEIIETDQIADVYGDGTCAGNPVYHSTVIGGNELPLVTLTKLGKVAIGSTSKEVTVGSNPTVILAYNEVNQTNFFYTDQCSWEQDTYTGAQSALVVNTGSNSISLLSIGPDSFPSGTVAVGHSPVAAVINSAETFAYIANYTDGTVSEVNLGNVSNGRTISVMAHPSALAFDSAGKLWAGGQGYMKQIDTASWSVVATVPIDGTVTGMSFDVQQGVMIQTLLQNGTVTARSNGTTLAQAIAFSNATPTSYSTTSLFNTTSHTMTTSSVIASDTRPYTASSLASNLAFAGQSAFVPPVYSASNGDLTATANGTSFTLTVISTGDVLVRGTVPYPIRGVALTSDMLYLTMPDSNSLITLPINLP